MDIAFSEIVDKKISGGKCKNDSHPLISLTAPGMKIVTLHCVSVIFSHLWNPVGERLNMQREGGGKVCQLQNHLRLLTMRARSCG